jgi:uncharacterized Zn finger protein (UPF0148 family)
LKNCVICGKKSSINRKIASSAEKNRRKLRHLLKKTHRKIASSAEKIASSAEENCRKIEKLRHLRKNRRKIASLQKKNRPQKQKELTNM